MKEESNIRMSQLKSAPHDFIQHAFSPMIAVMCTSGADEVCKKNNLTFVQLIKPFSKATVEGLLRDPSSNTQIPIRNLRVSLCDINSRPPPPPVARSFFNYSISSNVKEKTTRISAGEDTFDVPISTPWFEAWRDTFFQVQYPSDHEFTKHYIGCIIVVSSLDASPLERLEELLESLQLQINSGTTKLPKWFGTSLVLTTFIYLHDNSVSKLEVSVFEAMKVTYGINKCFLLQINSQSPDNSTRITDPWEKYISMCIEYKEEADKEREITQNIETAREAGEKSSPSTPDIVHPLSPITDDENYNICKDIVTDEILPPHGRLLNSEDIEKIKQFVNDFCIKALVPHFEQHIHLLSDQISNKKGVSRSLFSATKRWFGSNKPGTPGNHISPTAIAYSSDSHELQLRKLGDLSFMIGHYSLAFNAYHSAKRDFCADGAWLHYAGALEMAALSAFMTNSDALARKVVEYAEESILTYQNFCRMNQFATRATLLSVECLKGRGLFGEAAKQLIRMSGEDSDLRSAVLLEQAAYCFLSSLRPVMFRKYAFHMVLAGHRFSKAGHKLHSMRCYTQAYQVYGNKSWSVAEDHILYTIGKHASNLQMASNSVEALSQLMSRCSRQTPQQQEIYLKDYLTTIEQLDEVLFSIPVIDCNLTQVLLCVPSYRHPPGAVSASGFIYSPTAGIQLLSDEAIWWKLEEKLVNITNMHGSMLLFKPSVDLLTNFTNNSSCTTGFAGEPIGVCICMRNPLNIQIILKDVHLLWTVIPELGICQDSSQSSAAASVNTIKEIVLLPDSAKYVMLTITPNDSGELHITGLSYTLIDLTNSISVTGKQKLVILNKNKPDRRLQVTITKYAPRLDVSFSGLKTKLLIGEIIPLKVFLRNSGSAPISKIFLSSSSNFLIASENDKKTDTIFNMHLDKHLGINESLEKIFYIQPAYKGSTSNLELIFYYESAIENSKPRYRLSRHCWPTHVYNSLKTQSRCSRSQNSFTQYDQGVNIRIQAVSYESDLIKDFRIESINIVSSQWKVIPQLFPSNLEIAKDKISQFLVKAVLDSKRSNASLSTVKLSNNVMPSWCSYFISPPPEPSGYPNLDMVCIVSWSSDVLFEESVDKQSTRKAYGLHCVDLPPLEQLSSHLDDITSSDSEVNKVMRVSISDSGKNDHKKVEETRDFLSVKIQHPQRLSHQFSKQKLCVVPVKFWLENISKSQLSFSFEASPFPQTCITENNVSFHYIWLGKIVHKIMLLPASKICIILHAGITSNGAFDLSARLKIEAQIQDNVVAVIPKPEAVILVD